MRTLLTLIAFTFFFNVNAQEKKLQDQKQQFMPEQVAELQTKKMELKFELNDKQRKDLYQLNLKSAQKRQQNKAEMKARRAENKTLTADELYQKQIQRLDNQKKHQAEMKQILGEKQYLSWKESYQNKQMNYRQKDCNKKFASNRNNKNYRNNN